MHTIFYGQGIPTEVFSLWGKKINENLLVGHAHYILWSRDTDRGFFPLRKKDKWKSTRRLLKFISRKSEEKYEKGEMSTFLLSGKQFQLIGGLIDHRIQFAWPYEYCNIVLTVRLDIYYKLTDHLWKVTIKWYLQRQIMVWKYFCGTQFGYWYTYVGYK